MSRLGRRGQAGKSRILLIRDGADCPRRKACADAGVHTAHFAGIVGSSEFGAYSVVLSGQYEDDEDMGETL